MTFIGIFMILVGWLMAIGLGALNEQSNDGPFKRRFVMIISLGLIASGVYILC